METRKLYYEDSHLWTFSATVTSCAAHDKGYQITLDATAFYPEGGGQACDLGTLADARVLDVQERNGEVCHLCDKALEIGATVTGCIDKNRRFDLMQQHSGEHIVSGIVHTMLGHHNVGFHVGADVMTIDFDGPIAPETLQIIETRANEAVWANLPIRCWYPSEAELPTIPYRTKKALPWPVRIVDIQGIDQCACCGVHVKFTGEIGIIKLLSCVKFHQGVRIELVCGSRALQLLQHIFEENRQVSAAFSAKMFQTGAAARKMNEALAAEKLRANTLQSALFDKTAAEFVDAGNICRFQEGLAPAQVRELADRIAAVCGGWAAVFSGNEGDYSICIVSKHTDVKPVSDILREKFQARGGGKGGCFQGSVKANRAEIEAIFRELAKNYNFLQSKGSKL